MYVTRPLSQLIKSPELLEAAPDGPNSGFLVIQDEESIRYSFFGIFKNHGLKQLPFPQDKELTVQYSSGEDESNDPLFFIPSLNHNLSSNRYYAIVPHWKRIGEAFTSSSEEDKVSCCLFRCVKDVKPRPLDPRNIYQQIKILPYGSGGGRFRAMSVATDGYPPSFLRQKGWKIRTKTPDNFRLADVATGIDSGLRSRLPEVGSREPRVVGKWYTPFVFVKEDSLRDQVKRSMYYEVTLEQRWEEIFKTYYNKENSVVIDVVVEREVVFIGGRNGWKSAWNERSGVDGVIWFKPTVSRGGEEGIGLRMELVERMKWEEERGGWRRGEEREVKINKVEEFEGGGEWKELRCYVLVETFNLKRMDGSMALCYDFKHFHHLKAKWE